MGPPEVTLFSRVFSCFLVYSRESCPHFPAPCSAFLTGSAESLLSALLGRKALQGAGKWIQESTVFRVFSCFLVFWVLTSGLPTHHFEEKVAKR